MGNVTVSAQGLGKRYHIGALQQQHDRVTDQLLSIAAAPFRRASKLLRGHATGAAELDEVIWALRDVSFEIERGEVVGIIGRNGAGKSTLLKILSRITEPTEGFVEIFGRVGSLLEVGTGFHPELTGRENVFLNGALLGMKRHEIARKFDEIVAFAELEKFIDTPVKHYSSGMYVRLAFAVAAHLEPEILVVDEVLAVGDIAFQRKCLGKMEDVAGTGRTVLFVSHNLALVQTLCKRGIFLDEGRIEADADVSTATERYLISLETAASTPLHERTDREGKGEIRLTGLDIVDRATGDMTLRSGRDVQLVFYVNKLCAGLNCHFLLFNQLGQKVAYFKSNVSSAEDIYDINLGSQFICELNPLLLKPGRYSITVVLITPGEKQDVVHGAAFIDVHEGDLNGRRVETDPDISVTMPHRWHVPQSP